MTTTVNVGRETACRIQRLAEIDGLTQKAVVHAAVEAYQRERRSDLSWRERAAAWWLARRPDDALGDRAQNQNHLPGGDRG